MLSRSLSMRVPLLARPTLLASLHSSAASTSALNTAYLEPTHLDEAPPPAVLERLARYSSVSLSTYSRPPFIISRGAACTVWDSEGREYLDFSGGIAVNALGHADEGVAQVVAEQSRVLVHNSNLWHNEWAGELALLLVEKTKELGGMGYAVGGATAPDAAPPSVDEKGYPSSGLKVFFSNSGTEANEGALKFARKWGKQTSQDKVEIVSFRDGFHGRSMGALSGTWNPKYQAPFAPLIPGFVMGCLNGIGALQHTITEKTCGVIVEPIQGEGGIVEAKEEFLRAIRKRCDEVGALLIFDEIQCGLGRAGTLWAHSSLPVDCHPDILTMAKPLANGVPIGAILMKDKVADIIKIGDHGTTFGGGPLQTRVAHHVLTRLVEPSFFPNVLSLSTTLMARLAALPAAFPTILHGAPRGRGLILGLPFKNDELVGQVVKHARERGLLLLSCGKATVRFVPSLIVTQDEVNRCVDILESCLTVMAREHH